ncbi:major urinary protein-like [Gracilinanus agilis]|uniref:major urinary protein-like n=1 Tax=Gracilinanus agilis TaxID=191870 RepID=UPI001CFD9486|nr:major urinary protein-like [Gracilinanus agilis]
MRHLLLILGLALVCTFQAKATDSVDDFDLNKLAGRWYPIFLASSVKGSNSAAFIHTIKVKADKLMLYFTLRRNGNCKKVPVLAYRLENNKYKLQYPGNNVLYLEDADPMDYLLIYTTNEIYGRETKGVELYSRQKGKLLNQGIKSKFEQLYILHGLKDDNVIDLTNTDPCSHLSE